MHAHRRQMRAGVLQAPRCCVEGPWLPKRQLTATRTPPVKAFLLTATSLLAAKAVGISTKALLTKDKVRRHIVASLDSACKCHRTARSSPARDRPRHRRPGQIRSFFKLQQPGPEVGIDDVVDACRASPANSCSRTQEKFMSEPEACCIFFRSSCVSAVWRFWIRPVLLRHPVRNSLDRSAGGEEVSIQVPPHSRS